MRNFCSNKEVNNAINIAWDYLFSENSWFENEEEAEKNAGDWVFDFLFTVFEVLGIDYDAEEDE